VIFAAKSAGSGEAWKEVPAAKREGARMGGMGGKF